MLMVYEKRRRASVQQPLEPLAVTSFQQLHTL